MKLYQALISALIIAASGCGGVSPDCGNMSLMDYTQFSASLSSRNQTLNPELNLELNPELNQSYDTILKGIESEVAKSKLMFDWSKSSSALLCEAIKLSEMNIVVGADFNPESQSTNERTIETLTDHLEETIGQRFKLINYDTRLSTLTLKLSSCRELDTLRSSTRVKFVEPKFTTSMLSKGLSERFSPACFENQDIPSNNNPTFYKTAMGIPYTDYVRQYNSQDADIMQRHNVSEIYEQYQHYGNAEMGIAVIDNGVLAEDIPFLSHANGGFTSYGFYRPFGSLLETVDGITPKFYDFFGIAKQIKSAHNHGSRQLKHVFNIAPQATLSAARATSLPIMLLPSQYQGVIDSILAMAETPSIRIVSLSAGSIIQSSELIRAIDYFNSKDKILVAAAGTTGKGIKDLVNVVFPANLESTVAVTGIADTAKTGGKFILGDNSHGGPEVDFVVDYSNSSSEAVSTTAAMFALVWSANPELTRDQLITIFIESSSFYLEEGKPDALFGWGKVDLLRAYEKADESKMLSKLNDSIEMPGTDTWRIKKRFRAFSVSEEMKPD